MAPEVGLPQLRAKAEGFWYTWVLKTFKFWSTLLTASVSTRRQEVEMSLSVFALNQSRWGWLKVSNSQVETKIKVCKTWENLKPQWPNRGESAIGSQNETCSSPDPLATLKCTQQRHAQEPRPIVSGTIARTCLIPSICSLTTFRAYRPDHWFPKYLPTWSVLGHTHSCNHSPLCTYLPLKHRALYT